MKKRFFDDMPLRFWVAAVFMMTWDGLKFLFKRKPKEQRPATTPPRSRKP